MEHEEGTRESNEAKEFFSTSFSPEGYPRPLPGLSEYIHYYEWGSHPEDRPSKDEPARIVQQFRVTHRMFRRWENDQHKKRMDKNGTSDEGSTPKVQPNATATATATAPAAEHAGNRPVPKSIRTQPGRHAAGSRTIEDTGKKGPPLKGGRLKRKGKRG